MISALRNLTHRAVALCLRHDPLSRILSSFIIDAEKRRNITIRRRSMCFSIGSSAINEQFLRQEGGLCRFESIERETFDFLDFHLTDDDVFYDVGANFGMYVVYGALRAKLKHIVALEPEALNYAELCRNIHLNGLERVTALCVGASDKAAFENYYLRSFVAGNHSGRTRRYLGGEAIDAQSPENQFVPGYYQRIHLLPLDEVVHMANLPFPTVMLIDIDGGEVNALAGMKSVMGNPGLRAVVIETGASRESTSVHEVMRANGFRCVGNSGERRGNDFFVRG